MTGILCGPLGSAFCRSNHKEYECDLCGYIYDEAAGDPDNGIAPGTKWEDLPADWVCPLCGAGKDEFTAK